MLELIKYEKNHYEILKKWWDSYNWEHLSSKMIPPNTYLVYDNITKDFIAMSSLYITDGNLAYLGHTIASRNFSKDKKLAAIDMVVSFLINLAKEKNILMIYTTTNNDKIKQIYKHLGMSILDNKITNMGIAFAEDMEYFEE